MKRKLSQEQLIIIYQEKQLVNKEFLQRHSLYV